MTSTEYETVESTFEEISEALTSKASTEVRPLKNQVILLPFQNLQTLFVANCNQTIALIFSGRFTKRNTTLIVAYFNSRELTKIVLRNFKV